MNFVKILLVLIGLVPIGLHAQYGPVQQSGYKESSFSYDLFGLKGKEVRKTTKINPDGRVTEETKTVRTWERSLTYKSPNRYRSVIADAAGIPDLNNDEIIWVRKEDHTPQRFQSTSSSKPLVKKDAPPKMVLQLPTVPRVGSPKLEIKTRPQKDRVTNNLVIIQFPTSKKQKN